MTCQPFPGYADFVTDPRWLDADEQRAWRAYVTAHGRLAAALHRQLQTDSDLSLADFEVLVALTDVPDQRLRPFELGRALRWEKSRLSHHVARMERRGLVRREECPVDGRGAFVLLTTEGRRAIEDAAPRHVAAVRRLVFDGLSPQQVRDLASISETILRRIDAEPCDSAGVTGCSDDPAAP